MKRSIVAVWACEECGARVKCVRLVEDIPGTEVYGPCNCAGFTASDMEIQLAVMAEAIRDGSVERFP